MLVFYIFLSSFYPISFWKFNEVPSIADGTKYAATAPKTSLMTCVHLNQYCNFGEAQTTSSLMMAYVNQNMVEQLL